MDILRYLRGIGVALAFVALAIDGLIFLGIVQLAAVAGILLLAVALDIIAIILLPRYLGEKKNAKSKSYSLKKVKE